MLQSFTKSLKLQTVIALDWKIQKWCLRPNCRYRRVISESFFEFEIWYRLVTFLMLQSFTKRLKLQTVIALDWKILKRCGNVQIVDFVKFFQNRFLNLKSNTVLVLFLCFKVLQKVLNFKQSLLLIGRSKKDAVTSKL